MKKLVILDYSTSEVHIYDVDSGADIGEEYISDLGFHVSECAWMSCENLCIVHHTSIGALK